MDIAFGLVFRRHGEMVSVSCKVLLAGDAVDRIGRGNTALSFMVARTDHVRCIHGDVGELVIIGVHNISIRDRARNIWEDAVGLFVGPVIGIS